MTAPASIRLPAPAKINLFLHVLGRRADGYHRLQTLFQFLDHGDRLRLRRTTGDIRRLGTLPGVSPEADLCLRAARALRAATGTRAGVEIQLDKRLPMGAGLGGGSSDAASVLLGLNQLWSLGLSREDLARIGLGLGADVPVFVHGRAAWAEGVGERLTPVEPEEPWYLVLIPPVTVSTAEIFSAPELTRDTPPITISDFSRAGGRNDCEAVVRARYPEVGAALDWLETFAPARMTGTGGAVFAAFADAAGARAVQARVPAPWQAFVARGRNRSPAWRVLAAWAGARDRRDIGA